MTFRRKIVLAVMTAAMTAVIVAALVAWWEVGGAREAPPIASLRSAAAALAAGLGAAAVLAWLLSAPLARRLRALEVRAVRYGAGDLAPSLADYAQDEVGAAARTLDAMARDLSERTARLSTDRARMEAILSGMIEGVLVVNEHGRLLLANAAARRMLELDDAIEGRHYPEIVRHPAVAGQIAAALAGLAPGSVELGGVRDATQILMARSTAVTVGSGRAAVVVFHDITELRRTDRIRRDFVANVSHELRTPLTAIRGYVEALGDATPDETRRFLEVLSRHTRRMERLVDDLLRLARLDAGQERVEAAPCAMDGLLDAVAADLAPVLAARRQVLERHIEPDATTVAGDLLKLQDVFRNLLENAANYGPEGGRIVTRARRQGARIVITMTDEGPGIPPAELTRVFERFYRVDQSRTRGGQDRGGTGLGLSIVRQLVELHGGTVTAANADPHGAVFTVSLPAVV